MALWNGVDFSDTILIQRPEVTEQRFSTFLAALHRIKKEEQSEAIVQLMERAGKGSPQMLAHIFELAEKYLQDPNSPFRDEELLIPFLVYVDEKGGTDEAMRTRARFQLQMALKNRQGTIAEDFGYLTSTRQRGRLHELHNEYILLFFYNPECEECRQMKDDLQRVPVLERLQQAGRLQILALYPDEDTALWEQHAHTYPQEWITARYATPDDSRAFHLTATPSLYLLNHEKRVLLKDAPLTAVLKAVR
jgi:thiol-disulfide isomerase/thioredoxin